MRDAIEGLPEPAYFSRGMTAKDIPFHRNHWTMMPKSPKLLAGTSTDGRSFRRLLWDDESPTVAYGNREIHVHPDGGRRLSVHEAMLLQGFPRQYRLCGNFSQQITQVSNAVPPPVARALARTIRGVILASRARELPGLPRERGSRAMNDEEKLVNKINANLDSGKISEAKLTTDDRVLARITDGIYRQPASALRELIANAYDADASTVYIQTDFPKFSRISVRDDGNGLTVEGLANLIHHIGGSPKRTRAGIDLGVVSKNDPSLSPGGRRLIGKIGIGLFSVAQLTRHFQIITKTKGSKHRVVAEVMLKTYTEDDLATMTKQDHVTFETGTVRIKAFPAEKKEAHGTEIILLDLRKQTKELLQSRDTWLRVDAGRNPDQLGGDQRPPTYHIGRMAHRKR